MNQYELLPGSNYNIQLIQPASTPARIFCKTEILQPENYVQVETGDVVGVSLPTSNSLPIVASGATGYSLMTHTALNAPMTILTSLLTPASNMTFHLFPTIGKCTSYNFILSHSFFSLKSCTSLVPRPLPNFQCCTHMAHKTLLLIEIVNCSLVI